MAADDALLPAAAREVWRRRSDLQQAFPRPQAEDHERFCVWMLRHGVEEEYLPADALAALRADAESSIEPQVRAALLRRRGRRASQPFDHDLPEHARDWLETPARPPFEPGVVAFPEPPGLPRLAAVVDGLHPASGRPLLDAGRGEFARWFVADARAIYGIPERYLRTVRRQLPATARWLAAVRGLWLRWAGADADVASSMDATGDETRDLGPRPLEGLADGSERHWRRLLANRDPSGRNLAPLNAFTHALWRSNPFMQQKFPLSSLDGRCRFVYWLALVCDREPKLQEWLLGVEWTEFLQPVKALTEPGEPPIRLFDWLARSLHDDAMRQYPLATREQRATFRDWVEEAKLSLFGKEWQRVQSALADSDRRPGERPSPGRVGTLEPGVHVVEHPRATLGIREDTELNELALCQAGVATSRFAFLDPVESPDAARASFRYRVNLLHVNADQMLLAFGQLGPQLWRDRYTIGYWLWELPEFPPAWYGAFDLVDEIWVPSHYVQECLSKVSPVPVSCLPYAVRAEPDRSLGRADFGLPENDFLFLTTFDVSSFAARKNPLASVRAFHRAFPDRADAVGLVVKAANTGSSAAWAEVVELAQADARIHLFDELMVRDRLLALVASCDAYVSLHRSEGFGRGPAEALLLGKPIVVTDHSGNLDYSNPDTAYLVDHQLVAVKPGEYPHHQGQVWAEPDEDHAAGQMRALRDDPATARRLASAGQEFVREHYGLAAAGRRFRDRLESLGLL